MRCFCGRSSRADLREFGVYLCDTHYIESLRIKWSSERGLQGYLDFCHDALGEWFDPQYGVPDFHLQMMGRATDTVINRRYIQDSMTMFCCFRNASKSTHLQGLSAWTIVQSLRSFIVYMNDSEKKAVYTSLYKIKAMLRSPWVKYVYGDMNPKEDPEFEGAIWGASVIICNNSIRSRIAALGLNQPMNSLSSEISRPDLWIVDDPESKKNTMTETIRKKNRDIFFEQDLDALSLHAAMIAAQTPVHKDGLYFDIKEYHGVMVYEFPIYKKDENGSFIIDENGQRIPQWPKRFPLEWCLAKEEGFRRSKVGIGGWNKNYLLILRSDEERQIKEEWFQRCSCKDRIDSGRNWVSITSVNGNEMNSEESLCVKRIAALDPAVSRKGNASNTAMVITDVHWDYSKVVRDYFLGKYLTEDSLIKPATEPYYIEFDERNIQQEGIIGKCFRYANKWNIDILIVENVAAFDYLRQQIVKTYENWYIGKFKHRFTILPSNPVGKGEKVDRILSAVGKDIPMKRVYLTAEMRELVDQLVNLGVWNSVDLADALAITFENGDAPTKQTLMDFRIKSASKKSKLTDDSIEAQFHTTFL